MDSSDNASLPPIAVARINAYTPQIDAAHWAAVAEPTRRLGRIYAQFAPSTVTQVMGVLARFLLWCLTTGRDPSKPERLLVPALVDAFTTTELGHLQSHGRSSYRNWLKSLGGEVNPTAWPQPVATGRSTTPEPYHPAEQARLLRTASALPSELFRLRCRAAIVLGLASGVTSRDLRNLRPDAVRRAEDGAVEVVVGDPNPRVVVVLDRWADELVDAVNELEDAWIVGTADRTGRNITDGVVRVMKGYDCPDLSISRLRSTWIVEHLSAGTPLDVLVDAAGTKTAAWISDYLHWADPTDASTARAALRGAA